MDDVYTTTTYTVTPGRRYAFAFSTESTPDCELNWIDDWDAAHAFTLADSTTTIDSANASGGWEIIAPTSRIQFVCTNNYLISLTPIVI